MKNIKSRSILFRQSHFVKILKQTIRKVAISIGGRTSVRSESLRVISSANARAHACQIQIGHVHMRLSIRGTLHCYREYFNKHSIQRLSYLLQRNKSLNYFIETLILLIKV